MMRFLWRRYTSAVFFLHSYTWIAPTFISLLFASGGTASNATVKAEEMGATSTSASGTSSLEGLVVLGGFLVNFETISPFSIVGSELECWKVIHDSVHSMPPPSDEPLAGQVAYEQAEQYFMDGDYRLAGLYYLNALAWSNKNNDAYTFETCLIKFISSFDRLEDPAEGIMYLARIYLQSNHSNEARLYGMSLLQVALNINAMNEDARDLMEEFNIDCKLNDKFFSFECSQDGLQVTGSIGNKGQNFMDDKFRMKIVSDVREQIPEYLSPSECMNLNDKCGFWAEKVCCIHQKLHVNNFSDLSFYAGRMHQKPCFYAGTLPTCLWWVRILQGKKR